MFYFSWTKKNMKGTISIYLGTMGGQKLVYKGVKCDMHLDRGK